MKKYFSLESDCPPAKNEALQGALKTSLVENRYNVIVSWLISVKLVSLDILYYFILNYEDYLKYTKMTNSKIFKEKVYDYNTYL